jgi:hypothetical protein
MMLHHPGRLHSPLRVSGAHLKNNTLLLPYYCLKDKASHFLPSLAFTAALDDEIDGAQGRVLFPNALHEFSVDDFFAIHDVAAVLEGKQT